MHNLRDPHGLPAAKSALRYLVVRLSSRPDTAAQAKDIQHERDALVACEEASDQTREEWLGSAAVVRYLDRKLDRHVQALARDAMAMVDGNRADARYQKLFAQAPSEAMRGIADDP